MKRMQEQESSLNNKQVKINRLKLAFLLGLPIFIMGAAYFVFFTGVGMPQGTSNKGVLVNPPIQLNELITEGEEALIPDGNALWSFVVFGDEQCDKACRDRLFLTRQIKTSLHKHAPKVQRIYLNTSGNAISADLQAHIEKEHGGLVVRNISAGKLAALLATQEAAALSNPDADYYFADPRGFSMLYYTPEHNYKDTLKDVKFLLKHAPDN
jgi:hypothetical protein